MARAKGSKLSAAGRGFSDLPIAKQISVLLAIALSVAIGFLIVLWAKEPNLIPLYGSVNSAEAAKIIDFLDKNNTEYKYSPKDGGVLVAKDKVHEIRMQLAAVVIPQNSNIGYELLDRKSSIGTSQFIESVKYRRSLEGELARTIASLAIVNNARVHLGITKESSFLKRSTISSASVMVDLNRGQELDYSQVSGIVHLVASSVPGLKNSNITVVDQSGNLLTNMMSRNSKMTVALEGATYARQVEQELSRKIKDLLSPVYGVHGVRAEVNAYFDFTVTEQTKENYDTDKKVIRNEKVVAEKIGSGDLAQGVPGALSNQPPAVASAPEDIFAETTEGVSEEERTTSSRYRDQSTRNYEIDKTIIHQQDNVGKLIKLSVAVMINDRISYDENGTEIRTPLTEDEILTIETLVKNAIGFDEERGDSVSIVNSSFARPAPIIASANQMSMQEMLTQPFVFDLAKQVLGGIMLLLIIFVVIRPMVKSLAELKFLHGADEEEEKPVEPEINFDKVEDINSQARIEHVKKIAHDDSKKAAQVVMNWVGKEDD